MLAALLANSGPRRHWRRAEGVKDRARRMARVEAIPGRVVLAVHVRPWNPYLAADGEDVGTACEIGHGLLGAASILIDQQPCRRDLLEMPDQRMQDRALPRRVGDDHVRSAVMVDREGVLAGRDVAPVDAAQPVGFPGAAPGRRHRRIVRRRCGCGEGAELAGAPPWRDRIVVAVAALEVGPLAHVMSLQPGRHGPSRARPRP